MKYLNRFFISALAVMFLSACGGGGGSGSSAPAVPSYSGLTTPAAITETNAEVLAAKTTDATEEAIAQNAASESNPFGIAITSTNTDINPLIVSITRQIASHARTNINLPVGVTIDATTFGAGFCGGTITYPDNFGSGTLNGSVTYNNLCYQDSFYGQIIINGTVTFTETTSEITIRYINFTVTGNGLSETINMTVSCDTALFSCSISADFTGADGRTYRIADLTVTGAGTGPYYIDAIFYHPDHGYVTIAGSGLYYTCSNGYPGAGTITITGANGTSASITFTTCDGYAGTWDDGISSGSFSGTWL